MRLPVILWAFLKLTSASSSPFVDPNCPDYDLSEVCVDKCDDDYLQCVSSCSASECLLECGRALSACGDSCPCHTDCIDGCTNCENPICFCNDAKNGDNFDACFTKNSKNLGQCIIDCNNDSSCEVECVATFKTDHTECPCQEKCPMGCPCDGYKCDLPDKMAILTLYNSGTSNSGSTKPSVLIQPNGGITENFEFKMDDDTEVYRSCSALLYGELFVFGGYTSAMNKRKQVSKIVGCELKRMGDLNYEFYQGACGTYFLPDERILLCFSAVGKTKCESYDGSVYHNHADSKHGHHFTSLATIDNNPLAVGGYSDYTNKAETYDYQTNTWTEIGEPPYQTYIYRYATVTTHQGALILGGSDGTGDLATVSCYNNSDWSKLNDLQSTRYAHRAITDGARVFVVGGNLAKYTEIWSLDGTSENIKLAEPILGSYNAYPELFLVDTSFCVNP